MGEDLTFRKDSPSDWVKQLCGESVRSFASRELKLCGIEGLGDILFEAQEV